MHMKRIDLSGTCVRDISEERTPLIRIYAERLRRRNLEQRLKNPGKDNQQLFTTRG